jgi:hypothetical protein
MRSWKLTLVGVALLAFVAGLVVRGTLLPAQDLGKGVTFSTRYTVVHTEATNLIVTDNFKNILYFYTIDEGQEAGADLKLRGSIDLNKVGEATLRPMRAREKKE